MAHSRNTKPLWLIEPRLDAAEYRDKLIGSVIKHPKRPTEKRIPYRSSKLARDMIPNLDPKPMQVQNVRFWQRRMRDSSVESSFNDILDFFVERAKSVSRENEATVARIWHMDSPGDKFKDLLQNKEYFQELFDMLRGADNQQGYFVTDVVTLVNLAVTDENGSSFAGGGGIKAPIQEATGIPINVHMGGRYGVSREQGKSVTYEGELVVFLGYRRVNLDKVVGMRSKIERALRWDKHGFTIKDGFDYWPELVENPVEGDTAGFLNPPKPGELNEAKEPEEPEGHKEVVEMMGFDCAVVG
ncbi:hypothetical protein V2G26_020330 [Clonostachys chloroleuca]